MFQKRSLALIGLHGFASFGSINVVQSFNPFLFHWVSSKTHLDGTKKNVLISSVKSQPDSWSKCIVPQYSKNKSRQNIKSQLFGKLWDGLETEESDEIHWYLINCVAGLELDLLAQCQEIGKDYPDTDIVRFAVPTMKEARSHGKRNVVEDKVMYPGYVFAQLRLCEEVYEEISSLVTCRSWMGTQRRTGHKRLPSVPLPLSDDEIASFKGLEEKMEKEAELSEDELLKDYAGFEVEGMVKVLEGKHSGEDGIVKRLKEGKISVRLFTYGSQFDEWFNPSQLRPLTELEVMRGLGGRETPFRQDDFDLSIGKPVMKRGRRMTDDSSPTFSKRNTRNELMSNVKGHRGPRNRQQDRMARGESDRDKWGNSRKQLEEEQKNWQAYQKRKTDEQMNQNNYDVDSQWGRSSSTQNQKKNQDSGSDFFNSDFDDWSQFTSTTSNDESDGLENKDSNEDDFFNDLMSELSTSLDEPSDRQKSKDASSDSNEEDDFFSSLLEELSSISDDNDNDLKTDNDPVATLDNTNEDDFFSTLEKEMSMESSGSSISPPKQSDAPASQTKPKTEDDFFAQLEGSLSNELNDIDEAESVVAETSEPSISTPEQSDAPASQTKPKSEDDFFAQLEGSLSAGPNDIDEAESVVEKDSLSFSAPTNSDLNKLTVPVLKSMLKEKGLKVSGKKAELIERLLN